MQETRLERRVRCRLATGDKFVALGQVEPTVQTAYTEDY
jgi:hypothetical protein